MRKLVVGLCLSPAGYLLLGLHGPVLMAQPSPEPGSFDPAGDDPEALQRLVDDAVERMAAQNKVRALKALAQKNYPTALEAFQNAYGVQPEDAEVVEHLASLHALLGNAERAEAHYREALRLEPQRGSAMVGLAELLAVDDEDPARLREAAQLWARARELRGNLPTILSSQARIAARLGERQQAEAFYRSLVSTHGADDDLRLELGDFYRSFGRDEEALRWYRQIEREGPLLQRAAQRIFDLQVAREARRFGFRPGGGEIPQQVLELTSRAEALLAQGRAQEAAGLLREALLAAPQFGRARVLLGDVERLQERSAAAELAYLRALALDPGHVDAYERLAEMYLSQGPAQAGEAALLLERALAVRPDQVSLQLRLAEALRAAGDFPRALFHVERYLAQNRDEQARAPALRIKQALEALLGPPSDQPASAPNPSQGDAAEALARARAHLGRGATDAALAELRRLPQRARAAEVLNLEARILHAADRSAEAVQAWRQSLSRDPKQAQVLLRLGQLEIAQGQLDTGRARLVQAELLGHLPATYELAAVDAGTRPAWLSVLREPDRLLSLLHARERIARYRSREGDSERRAAALQLREHIDRQLLRFLSLPLLLLLGLVGSLAVLRQQRHGGLDIRGFLASAPEAGPEVQRVLASIRHEVLKHNTLMLAGLLDALHNGQGAGDKARHLTRALFGAHGTEGAAAKLAAYADNLRQLGRAHGVRLNLERKDPAMSALLAGFSLLRREASRLQSVEQLSLSRRQRLSRSLAEAVALLNEEGYGELQALLSEIRRFVVDAELIEQVFDEVRAEPALASAPIAPLELSDDNALPCALQLPHQAFAEVLTNLFRNAIQASLDAVPNSAQMVEVGLRVVRDIDPITGIERVVFRVRDRARGELTTSQLRGQPAERGLGLSAELVSRYEGFLEVEPQEPGWNKAVVVAFPSAEPEEAYS